MANLTHLYLLMSLAFYCSCGQKDQKFFRKDYHFIESENSFYKIHVLPLAWLEAKQMCDWEGATLFYPDNEGEYTTVLSYLKETQGLNETWLGISSLLAKGVFVTINGTLMMDVYNKWNKQEPNNLGDVEDCVVAWTAMGVMNDDGCFRKKPYICKKTLSSFEWKYSCNTPYTDYVYNETLGKCYKFHHSPKNWTEAYTICSSELSYLAVIDSQEELDHINEDLENFVAQNTKIKNCCRGTGFVGYHNRLGNGWRTINDVSLEGNEEFDWWGVNQPNNGNEECGAISDGRLHDFPCSHRCYFICEHDIQ